MFKTAFSLMALVPAALAAQVAAGASAQSHTKADARIGKGTSASVESSTSADAEISAARARGLPERPIRRRVAEGRAKGASDAQLAVSARTMRLTLESAEEAMVSAGRARPSGDEIERGAYAMERGYTSAQIQAVTRSAPSDRSLVVAFDVLARLQGRGVPVGRALAQVESKLASRASDASIDALVSANTNANANVGAGASRVTGATSATATGNAAAGAAASGVSGAASATGTVTGAVGGVIKKP
ncbi:MAG TPA: hypothetical protein VIF32_09120 [Gemmatimonadaceae bacterium]